MRVGSAKGVSAGLAMLAALHASAQQLRWMSSGPLTTSSSYSLIAHHPDRGVVFAQDSLGDSWEWDGDQWTQVGRGGPADSSHRLVYDPVRRVFVAPGYGLAYEGLPGFTAWHEFDGARWTSFQTPLGPVPRGGAAAAYDPIRGGVVMTGGVWTFRESPSGSATVGDEWLLINGVWANQGTPAFGRRSGCRLAFDSTRGATVLVGGTQGPIAFPEVWERDADTPWTLRSGDYPIPLGHLSDDPVHGGVSGLGSVAGTYDSLWTWDGSSWSLRPLGPVLDAPGYIPNYARDPQRGVTVAWGSWKDLPSGNRADLPQVWERADGGAWAPRLAEPPLGRSGAGMVWDEARGAAVMFGGYTGHTGNSSIPFVADPATWTTDGRTWTRHDLAGPAQRMTYGMCYDSRRHVTVVYGGRDPRSNSTAFHDTWEWDGSAWIQRDVSGPGDRLRTTMCFDRRRGKTVLFGGWQNNGALGDTWEYDGAAWTRIEIAGPGARYRHAMAFDEARGVIVLYAGMTTAGGFLGDTWEYDGAAWSLRSTAGPSARVLHTMVYDPVRRVSVMWGGSTGATYPDETWEWDGSQWRQRTDLFIPGPRGSQSATIDPETGRLFAFGGSYATNGGLVIGPLRSDLWTLGASCPAPVIERQPAPAVACNRGGVSLSVGARGETALRYQWRRGEQRHWIPGADGPTLELSGLTLADAGRYDCIVITDGPCFRERVVSEPTVLTVCVADFDCSGMLDLDDYSAFIEGYELGAEAADVTGDGFLDFFDHDAFVEQWERGCGG